LDVEKRNKAKRRTKIGKSLLFGSIFLKNPVISKYITISHEGIRQRQQNMSSTEHFQWAAYPQESNKHNLLSQSTNCTAQESHCLSPPQYQYSSIAIRLASQST